ncbi:nitrate- and nitrite sensing domain-containing protein [Nocardia sp. NPDC051030]|uniref:sensor histidine kinase n=1 Tax=Nocardia sp. NPDC051030 TaxID=3155162 RepID=UPI003443B702
MLRLRLGVRTRILAIALVPSLALVVIGVGATGVLADRSSTARNWADQLKAGIVPTREFIEAVQLERRITLWRNAGAEIDVRELTAARLSVDNALRLLAPAQSKLSSMGPESMSARTTALGALSGQLATVRAGVDAGTLPLADAFVFYGRLPDQVVAGIEIAQQTAPDAATAAELAEAEQVLRSLESMSRATALGAALATDSGLPPDLANDFIRQIGYYRTRIEQVAADSDPEQAAVAKALITGPAWQQLGTMETALAQHALPRTAGSHATPAPLPMSIAEWQTAAEEVDKALAGLWQAQTTEAQRLAGDAAAETTRNSIWAGAAMLVVAVGAILVALALANRIIRRLKGLRDRTLALADVQLPETMRRLAAGEELEPAAQTPALDFGRDEIGQVAEAFGHAHATAVAAAVTEARTREGVRSVFLNIAHRSQIVVHKQLELLDEAESKQEDPSVLDTFFRLDHLATRERRNAENLVILAGGQPGRQWRNPVPLLELVRSAVGETEDYKRVRTGRMPQAFLVGIAVGDLIHLLAELIDNATSFSPPQSRVELAGSTVGRGVAVEISDQGMGVPEPELDRINTLLSAPVDFGVTTLSQDSRLGLFVVSQLAARHGISVRLSESDYGGIRAIVLIPGALLAGELLPAPVTGQFPIQPGGESQSRAMGPKTWDSLPEPPRAALEPEVNSRPALRAESQAWASPAAEAYSRPDVAREVPPRPNGSGTHPRREVDPTKPSLPRRHRQASLAPELAHDPTPAESTPPTPAERSAEQARDLFSAIETGTRQGRRTDPGQQ